MSAVLGAASHMLGFMHKVAYMLLMVDYGGYADRERLKGTDSTTDHVVMHIAEVSSNYNCRLECFLTDEYLVILSMIGGVNEVTL